MAAKAAVPMSRKWLWVGTAALLALWGWGLIHPAILLA
jgi:hypothetical protein